MKNYIKRVTMALKSDENPEKQVFNASRKAENHLTQVISKLESEKVDAEISLEEATEKYETAKYSIDWLKNPAGTLNAIDNAKKAMQLAQETLDNIIYTLNERKALLEEYKTEIKK